jgi:hypothetical protein
MKPLLQHVSLISSYTALTHNDRDSSAEIFIFFLIFSQALLVGHAWLRWLLSLQRPGSIHVGFVVDKVALGQVVFRFHKFSPVSIIPLWFSVLLYHLGDEQYAR